MRIAFGTDEDSAVTTAVERHLVEAGHELLDAGHGAAWPDVGRGVGVEVADAFLATDPEDSEADNIARIP